MDGAKQNTHTSLKCEQCAVDAAVSLFKKIKVENPLKKTIKNITVVLNLDYVIRIMFEPK